jgi:hypothetical protein
MRTEAVVVVNSVLGLDGSITVKGDEFKCLVQDLEGTGFMKLYLNADDCERMADAFTALAAKLRDDP